MLVHKGHKKITIDGIAGVNTISALMEYQQEHRLVYDGICGKKTRETLKSE